MIYKSLSASKRPSLPKRAGEDCKQQVHCAGYPSQVAVYHLHRTFTYLLPSFLLLVQCSNVQDTPWRLQVTFTPSRARYPTNLFRLTAGRRAFSRSAARQNYDATIQNLLIHKDTRVLCQGLTGKTVSAKCTLRGRYSPTHLGHFPRERGIGVWHEHGRRCLTKEGGPNSPRSSYLRVGQRGQCHYTEDLLCTLHV